MNVWLVYAEHGAYSSSFRWAAAVFSTRAAADAYAEAMEAKAEGPGHDHGPGPAYICYGTHYESSGDDFWIVDAEPKGETD